MSRKRIYKTPQAKKLANAIAQKRWRAANPEKVIESNLKQRKALCKAKGIEYKPRPSRPLATSEIEAKIANLEAENKRLNGRIDDIMDDHEELLKEWKKLSDFLKWGKK